MGGNVAFGGEGGAEAENSTLDTPNSALIQSRPLSQRVPLPPGETLFEELPSSRTGVEFQLQFPNFERYFHEIIHLSVYGGVCTGDYDNDGLTDFYITSPAGGNRLYHNLGDFRFEDVTEITGLSDPKFWGVGATFADIDNDGDLDLYACGYRMPNRLFINQGKGSGGHVHFQESAKKYGLDYEGASMTMAFADIDNDGDLDGYLATTAVPPPRGVKFRVEFEGDKPVIPKELQEYWGLIYLPGERAHPTEAGQFDHLYRNDGGHFTEISDQAGIEGPYFTLGAIWWDFNGDRRPDLYVANDYLGPDMLYRNNGDGTFTNVIKDAIPHTPWSSMGMDIGDVNNDGLMDLMATDMFGSTHYRRQVMRVEASKQSWFLESAVPRQYGRNALYLNTGAGRMLEGAWQANLAATDWTWAPRIEDFDNDGRLDVFVGNGMTRDVQHADLANYSDRMLGGGSTEWVKFWESQPMRKEANMAFRNFGGLRFENMAGQWGLDRTGVSFGVATADFDNDGDLDLIVNNGDAPASLYRNRSGEEAGIRVRLKGTRGNPFGLGATVRVTAGGMEQTRYLTVSRGWLSGSEPIVHFGLGSAEKIDSLTVEWPSGRAQSFEGLAVNQMYEITEPSESEEGNPAPNKSTTASQSMFVESDLLEGISHEAVPFDDFAHQPLLPEKLSQKEFCMAWADVDGDGDEDFYFGGAKGIAGRLYIRNDAGRYALSDQPVFQADQDREDAAAVFFDFDGDKDLDLYVVSGGVREAAGDASYQDRLYFNQGNGAFTSAPPDTLPPLTDNGSCVTAADFDQDGDIDLFVGGYSLPGKYPLSAASHLLIHEGGKFVDRTPSSLKGHNLVTDVFWADADGDGRPDLLLASEWGAVKFFRNEDGTLADRTQEAGLDARRGWWNAIAGGDIDHDGDVDYVVGNRGLNTRYKASPKEPQLLFYGDFDGTGNQRLLEAFVENGKVYPHRGFDSLAKAMPSLTARISSYARFAAGSLDELFPVERLKQAVYLEANTAESGVLINNGKAQFEFSPLPPLAQIAPVRDLALVDVDSDGNLDLILAQNDFSPNLDTGRMDGGVGLLLLGDGAGKFNPIRADESGIVVPGDVPRLAITDLDADGRRDVVFGVQNGPMKAFIRNGR